MGKSVGLLTNLKGKTKKESVEELSIEKKIEEAQLQEEKEAEKGTKSTSFPSYSSESQTEAASKNFQENSEEVKNTKYQKGITPPINGEYFDIKRSYQMRKSTVRMLNELKACHPDVNVYLNTILDAAIRRYYDYIFNQGGKQE